MSEVKVNKISPRIDCGTTQLGDAGDTITVTGDLKSNSLKSASGSTITLGQSGDTIQLGCGASQTGFGRTGTVDWDTTAKTASFTAVSGNGYFVNTTSGAITLTLPASPSAGDIVAFKDYAFTFATNNLTVDGNGSPIGGVDGTILPTYSTNGTSKTFIYVDGTKGWLVTNESTDTSQESNISFVTATGGTVTCCGDYKIHTFTGPGTFCVSCAGNPLGSDTVDYLVIAGGGSGANAFYAGGGGGAGGYRESSGAASGCYSVSPLGACVSALPVSAQGYPITVGAGGPGSSAPPTQPGSNGSNSIFSTITSAGGGGGAEGCAQGSSGGSGGGSSTVSNPYSGGAGNTPPVSPPQGQPGGGGGPGGGNTKGSGGGGATSAGTGSQAPNSSPAGPGGNGATSSINGTPTTRAGGGGGSTDNGSQGTGGPGGGGNGGITAPTIQDGTVNTGSGGGSGGGNNGNGGGGSGIVIIRYKYQ
jgi:hypothetical protein